MSTFVFFSSDAMDLYKNDVFRCLSLPNGYCVRFRYLTKYLWNNLSFGESSDDDDERHRKKVAYLKQKFNTFRNKEALVCFVSGNHESDVEASLEYHCIRRVIVQDYFYEDDLDEFNFILRLDEFENAEIPAAPEPMPPTTWVTEVDVANRKGQSWIRRVNAVEEYFGGTVFFHLKRVLEVPSESELAPTFSKEKRESHFALVDDSTYILESVFYDPSGALPIKSDTEGESITILHPARVGARQDHKRIGLYTKAISQKSAVAKTCFHGNDTFYVELNWSISKSWRRTLLFGICTMIAACGACLLFLARTNLTETVFSPANLLVSVGGAGMIGGAASCLYYLFHKK